MTRTALVTGHAGFIGRHMCRHLRAAGYTICGIDRRNGAEVRQFFDTNRNRFDLAIHLAAIVGGRVTIDGQPMAVAVDLAIDADWWQWVLRMRPGRAVYFSSAAAYSNHRQEPVVRRSEADGSRVTVEMPPRLSEDMIDLGRLDGSPDMTYGWAKLTGELQAGFVEAEGVPVNVFRPFSGYAEDQDAQWYPFPAFIDRAKRKADPFEVWGTGAQTRDFIHVDDICGAVLAAVDQEYDNGPVNLCTGRATTLNQLAALCAKEVGYRPTIKNRDEQPTGPSHRVGDPTKLNEFYTAKVSLEEGIARAVAVR